MKKPGKKPVTFVEKMNKLKASGLAGNSPPNTTAGDPDLPDLAQRVRNIMGIFDKQTLKPNQMIFFVMYDIENNKVRNLVSKYLIRKGCTRVQKSIFLAQANRSVYDEIKNDLKEVQGCYENSDSILLVPVSTEQIQAMKIIGTNIDFDLILGNRNTLFF
jgi:CRISPR-associated protein Cas2